MIDPQSSNPARIAGNAKLGMSEENHCCDCEYKKTGEERRPGKIR